LPAAHPREHWNHGAHEVPDCEPASVHESLRHVTGTVSTTVPDVTPAHFIEPHEHGAGN